MNENVYKRLLDELNDGKKAIMVTLFDNRKCENKTFNKKILITEENLLKISVINA